MAMKLVTLPVQSITSGTPLQLPSVASPHHCFGILVQAPAANAGNVYVGDSGVSKSAPRGYELAPGQTFGMNGVDLRTLQSLNLEDLWLDGTNTGDKVLVSYLTER